MKENKESIAIGQWTNSVNIEVKNEETNKKKDDFTQNKKGEFLNNNIKTSGCGIGIKTNKNNNINNPGLAEMMPQLKSLLDKAAEEDDDNASVAKTYLGKQLGFRVEDRDRKSFAKCISDQLLDRLGNVSKEYENEDKNWGDLEKTLEEEKKFWKDVNWQLGIVGLFDYKAQKEADKKIDDIYDLSGFLTFLQWLGCTLSVPLTFGLSLLYSPIKNRVCLHTKTSRILERLRDRKNDLTALLQQVQPNDKKPNTDNLNLGDNLIV